MYNIFYLHPNPERAADPVGFPWRPPGPRPRRPSGRRAAIATPRTSPWPMYFAMSHRLLTLAVCFLCNKNLYQTLPECFNAWVVMLPSPSKTLRLRPMGLSPLFVSQSLFWPCWELLDTKRALARCRVVPPVPKFVSSEGLILVVNLGISPKGWQRGSWSSLIYR